MDYPSKNNISFICEFFATIGVYCIIKTFIGLGAAELFIAMMYALVLSIAYKHIDELKDIHDLKRNNDNGEKDKDLEGKDKH